LLEKIPQLLLNRKSFGGRRIPVEQFVDKKILRFKARAGTSTMFPGIAGPVTEEIIYLLCNGQRRMGVEELRKSRDSLELWDGIEAGEEEQVAMDLMKAVIDRNAGQLAIARERLETQVIGKCINKRLRLTTNDWVMGFAYYEVRSITYIAYM
jgi:Protein of unknown function (DUF3808)